jgi:HEPN domain-containing protein/predicted nucleotidyltransferase
MKTVLEHLPPHKRDLITALAGLVQEGAPVEMLILFGSYARGDWVEDPVGGYVSDVDLMVVVATEEAARKDSLWADLERRARALSGRVPVTLVVHDIKQVNQEIRSGQYFFADVVSEGVLLYDSRRVQLARPKALGPRERLDLATYNFRYWFESAGDFYRGAGYYAGRGLRSHAAFLLHQAAERYFHAALLVFTGYKPKTHDIELLANQTAPLHPAMQGALPREDPEDNRLFKLLKRAYIEARYSKSYRVTAEEFAVLSPRVRDLGARVRAACSEKLGTFCGPEAVGALPEEPDESDVGELPDAPPLDGPGAFEAWRDALVTLTLERGEARGVERGREEGKELGLKEGEARGVERGLKEGEARARANAILDVLRRRGIALSDADAQRILACRDESALALYWERAFSAASAAELLGD